jgi:xylulose-5-phosphate/fructose-6-phosphate phosphoketolase
MRNCSHSRPPVRAGSARICTPTAARCASRCTLPDFRDYAVAITAPGAAQASPTATLALLLRDVMRDNMTNFRVFGPDETASNRLEAIYDVSKKTWLAAYHPDDADGG